MTSTDIYPIIEKHLRNDVKNFTATILYIKRIKRDCGKYIYYFGKTKRLDIAKSYLGSGTLWSNFIRKYGKSSIETVWISDAYTDALEIQKVALLFSVENNIVDSGDWANLKLENGLDGGCNSDNARRKVSATLKAKGRTTQIENGGTKGTIWITNGVSNYCISLNSIIPEGWYRGRSKDTKCFGLKNSVYGKTLYTNGKENKFFHKEDCIPEGWYKGRKV
jgi:hypothetical protein